jgi:hypothetical protein
VFPKFLESHRIFSGNKVLPTIVSPANASRAIFLSDDGKQVSRVLHVPRVDLTSKGYETLEADDLATLLEIQDLHDDIIVELRCEGLVVDEHNVSAPKHGIDFWAVEKVAL